MHEKFVRFSDAEYSIIVLQGLKRMVRRSDYFTGYVVPRDVMRDSATASEVTDALQYAIEKIRVQLHMSSEELAKKLKYEDITYDKY
jgi:ribosome-binding protein aMBF1 (putative translation factor)